MPCCWQTQQRARRRLCSGSADAQLTPEMLLTPTQRSWGHGGPAAGTALSRAWAAGGAHVVASNRRCPCGVAPPGLRPPPAQKLLVCPWLSV